jgi:hypothetical protein
VQIDQFHKTSFYWNYMLAFSGKLWRSQFSSWTVLYLTPVWHLEKTVSYTLVCKSNGAVKFFISVLMLDCNIVTFLIYDSSESSL